LGAVGSGTGWAVGDVDDVLGCGDGVAELDADGVDAGSSPVEASGEGVELGSVSVSPAELPPNTWPILVPPLFATPLDTG
jgi:hypothetical protein